MPSDAESSSDDDAKTERRDPTPPPDGWMPGCPIPEGTVARIPRHEATATGLRLPMVTREEAREEQMQPSSSDDENTQEAAAPAPKKKEKKQPRKQKIPMGNQLSVWVFRYSGDGAGVKIIDYDLLAREAKIKLKLSSAIKLKSFG